MARIEYVDLSAAGQYNDGDQVEQDILQYAKTIHEDDYWKIFLKDQRWPVFYHLTDMRENILNWYGFDPEGEILEIGGGMGALTGLLCRKGKTVTTVELTKQRADVIYARHGHFDNLTVLVGNFNDIQFTKKYDYITLIGVLEYARGFVASGREEDFLTKIRQLLKPHGKILIAIENRFGCKYWCGAKEDHLGKPYIGINGYPGVDSIRTYSRQELSDLLDRCGLPAKRFYYPLPDYKLPQVVYSDRRLPSRRISRKIIPYYPDHSKPFSDEHQIYDAAIQNQVFPFFANSFFVECGAEGSTFGDITYASFTPGRRKRYKVVTTIHENGTVEKRPDTFQAAEHLKDICRNQQKYTGNNLAPYEDKGDFLRMEYLQGESLEAVLYEALKKGDVEEAGKWLEKLYDCIKHSSRVTGQADEPVLEDGFLDMTPMNCIIQDGVMTFFDQEWLEKDIPASFLLYRAIRTFYAENPELEESVSCETMLEKLGIDSSRMVKYHPREQAFLEKVEPPEMNPMAYLNMNRAVVDQTILDAPARKEYLATVYFDLGNGYSEENKQSIRYYEDEVFRQTIEIPAEARSMRFDPAEGCFCLISNMTLVSDGRELEYACTNGRRDGEYCYFSTLDPQITVDLQDAGTRIEITCNICCFNDQGLSDYLDRSQRIKEKEEELLRLRRVQREYEEQVKNLQQANHQYEEQVRNLQQGNSDLTDSVHQLLLLCGKKDQMLINQR